MDAQKSVLQKLSFQLEAQRKENRALQQQVSQFEDKEAEYAHTVLLTNRAWDQLVQDVEHLCTSSGLDNIGSNANSAASTSSKDTPSIPANITDPYLRQLLKGADAACIKTVNDSWKQVDGHHSEVERALLVRANTIKTALANLLQHVRQLSVSGSSSASPDVAKLQQQLHNQAAMQRMLSSQLHQAQDRNLEAQETIKKLQNELADTEQELTNAQRRLHALKHAEGDGAGPSTSGLARAGSVRPGTPAPEDAPEEVAQLQQLLAKRTAELDAEREAHLKVQRCGRGEP